MRLLLCWSPLHPVSGMAQDVQGQSEKLLELSKKSRPSVSATDAAEPSQHRLQSWDPVTRVASHKCRIPRLMLFLVVATTFLRHWIVN